MNEYPDNWREIATAVKAKAGGKCIRCGHPHDTAAGYMLTVHHLDMDKANCSWWNCVALCQRCHLSVQARVKPDQPYFFRHSKWFRIYAAGFYAKKYLSEDVTREQAEARLTELLKLEQVT